MVARPVSSGPPPLYATLGHDWSLASHNALKPGAQYKYDSSLGRNALASCKRCNMFLGFRDSLEESSMKTYISSLGKFLPGDPVDNDAMEQFVGKIAGKPS